jgi:hypothetical protein
MRSEILRPGKQELGAAMAPLKGSAFYPPSVVQVLLSWWGGLADKHTLPALTARPSLQMPFKGAVTASISGIIPENSVRMYLVWQHVGVPAELHR